MVIIRGKRLREKILLEMADRNTGKKLLKQGILIAIEGIDGAGKTTQSKILLNNVIAAGYSAVLLHEPTNGQYGQKIRELAKNGRQKTTPEEELELFYRDRIEDVKNNIDPKLKDKFVVIMDRYYYSNVTYQGAMGLDPEYVEKMNERIAPEPAMVIILDIVPSESLKRIRATREDGPNAFEKQDYLEKVRKLFLKHFESRNNVAIIDGDGNHTEKEVAESVWSLVQPLLEMNEAR